MLILLLQTPTVLLRHRLLVSLGRLQPPLQPVDRLLGIDHLPVKLFLLLPVVIKRTLHLLLNLLVVLPGTAPLGVNVGVLLLRLGEARRQVLDLAAEILRLDRRQRGLVLDAVGAEEERGEEKE